MIQITAATKILVGISPIDFRCGIDSLVGLIKSTFEKDPFSGHLFVFTNKSRIGLKILSYDGQGFWFCYKRLSQGSLTWWPSSEKAIVDLDAKNMMLLLFNGDVNATFFQKNWKDI